MPDSCIDSSEIPAPRLSVYIITLNEERNIQRALESVSWADEIIIVDSGSTDKTCDIANSYGVKVVTHTFHGYSKQKNYALELCSGDWTLNIDADEEVTDELRSSIQAIVSTSDVMEFSSYELTRRTWYLGKWIRHCGWYPEYRMRLSHRGNAEWTGDMLHERLICSGKTGRLTGNLNHRPYHNLGEHLQTIERYSALFADREYKRGRKPSFISLILRPPVRFFKMYFLRHGFLDRGPGFIASAMGAWYTFMKYARLYERARGS